MVDIDIHITTYGGPVSIRHRNMHVKLFYQEYAHFPRRDIACKLTLKFNHQHIHQSFIVKTSMHRIKHAFIMEIKMHGTCPCMERETCVI